MLAIANSIRLLAMLLLAISVGFDFITLPLLLLTTFLFGIGEVIYDTTMQSMLPEVLEVNQLEIGIQYLYESKRLLRLVLMTSGMGFFYAVSSSTMVLFILDTLKTPTALLGVILATPAIGALLGSMIAQRLSERFGRMRVMASVMVLSAVVTVLMGLSPNYWTLALLLTISSLIVTHWNILLMATYHQIIPTHLFGFPFFVGGLFCLLISLHGYRFVVGLGDMLVTDNSGKN